MGRGRGERARVTAAAGGVEVGGEVNPCDRAAWKGDVLLPSV